MIMKILLLGEYSGVHCNIKEMLLEKGHDVVLIHDGDSYKKYGNNDLSIHYDEIKTNNKFLNKLLKVYYLFLNIIGLKGILKCLKYKKELIKLSNFDVVQLINTKPFSEFGTFANIYLLRIIFKKNKNVFLCALGDDFVWVKSCLKKYPPYSMFDNLNFYNLRYFIYSLNYVYGGGAKILDTFVFDNICKVIPGLYDYYYAYKKMGRDCTEVVPIPLKINLLGQKNINYPIKIFHGWQIGKELRKGNIIFDNAIKKICNKYPNLVEYVVVKNLPYDEYIKLFVDSDIIVDQCFSLDRGMNALLGMAHGKVVLSGCDLTAKDYYSNGLENCLINAEPDEQKIFSVLEDLILNTNKIEEIQSKSVEYIIHNHNYELIYDKYLKIWSNN